MRLLDTFKNAGRNRDIKTSLNTALESFVSRNPNYTIGVNNDRYYPGAIRLRNAEKEFLNGDKDIIVLADRGIVRVSFQHTFLWGHQDGVEPQSPIHIANIQDKDSSEICRFFGVEFVPALEDLMAQNEKSRAASYHQRYRGFHWGAEAPVKEIA